MISAIDRSENCTARLSWSFGPVFSSSLAPVADPPARPARGLAKKPVADNKTYQDLVPRPITERWLSSMQLRF